jgi:hypothetical protein
VISHDNYDINFKYQNIYGENFLVTIHFLLMLNQSFFFFCRYLLLCINKQINKFKVF